MSLATYQPDKCWKTVCVLKGGGYIPLMYPDEATALALFHHICEAYNSVDQGKVTTNLYEIRSTPATSPLTPALPMAEQTRTAIIDLAQVSGMYLMPPSKESWEV